jgi:hypothetical protein
MARKLAKEKDLKAAAPTRFVIQIIDTKNTHGEGEQEQFFNWAIGFDSFKQLREPIAEEDGGTEIARWLNHVEEQTNKMKKRSKSKGYTSPLPMESEEVRGE